MSARKQRRKRKRAEREAADLADLLVQLLEWSCLPVAHPLSARIRRALKPYIAPDGQR